MCIQPLATRPMSKGSKPTCCVRWFMVAGLGSLTVEGRRVVRRIKVTLRRARLVLGLVTVFSQKCQLGRYQPTRSTSVYSRQLFRGVSLPPGGFPSRQNVSGINTAKRLPNCVQSLIGKLFPSFV